jgi:hypothetical protein
MHGLENKNDFNLILPWCHMISVSEVIAYGLKDLVSVPSMAGISLSQHNLTNSGTHPASYPTGTGGSFPREYDNQHKKITNFN